MRIGPPHSSRNVRNWTRFTLAERVQAILEEEEPVIVGIDHGFSFPMSYMEHHGFKTGTAFSMILFNTDLPTVQTRASPD